ncbi:MAG TPA: ABC transporter substrate-binding protein [Rhodopila sp.]|nr:ABC transporter substrate-binding protein [Rhodopila sp.]
MRHGWFVTIGALMGLGLSVLPVHGEPFKCPHLGGGFVFGQEANFGSLDQMASDTISVRNIAMNIYESLMTRDENDHPILELAAAMHESRDHMTYTFKLRHGVHFHNGKLMTSADVAASFDRYAKVGYQRSTLDNVDHWDAPNPDTFVIHMKQAQPTFIEMLSSFSAPIVIMPAEQRDVPALGVTEPIGTGPFQFAASVPGRYVKLKRFEGYAPNTSFQQRTGLGGYKQACLDTVTFRIVTDPAARVAGLQSGALQAVEDVPAASEPGLKQDPNIVLLPMKNWWIQIASPNTSNPPTDNLLVRKAVQAALDMNEIMNAAAEGGDYTLNPGLQFPEKHADSTAGKDTYNLKDPDLARKYLAQAGYRGEPVVLLTNRDYPSIYNAALTMQQELQAVGINAQMKVVDWPTSAQMWMNTTQGWNIFFSGWGTQPALGPLATMQLLVQPNAAYKPKDGQDDPDLLAAWQAMTTKPTVAGRQKAFAQMQQLVLDRVYAIPFGVLGTVQATRADVQGFVPFRVPRMANVWLSH